MCYPRFDRYTKSIYNSPMTEKILLQSSEYARLAVDVASDKLASDVVMLDIRKVSDFTDFFVILTVESTRQMRSLVDDLEMELQQNGATLHHREGAPNTGWMLLDFADVIVHLMTPDKREFYDIEGMWSHGVEVVRIL